MHTRIWILILSLFASGCTFVPGACVGHVYDGRPYFFINRDGFRDLQVVVDGDIPWMKSGKLPYHVINTLKQDLTYWGSDTDELESYTIIITTKPFNCGFKHLIAQGQGCTNPWTKTITVGVVDVPPCVEATDLHHEVGHAVHPFDLFHLDSNFRNFKKLYPLVKARPDLTPDCRAEMEFYPQFYDFWNSTIGS